MFKLVTTNNELLKKATNLAENYANKQITNKTVGIVFLGGIARNYFDHDADIDIAIFENNEQTEVKIGCEIIDGIEVQTFLADYKSELNIKWDMSKRWAYSNNIIFCDTDGLIQKLLNNKVPLQNKERHTLMISGITLSEWYCNRLLDLWIRRGSLSSAHYMFNEGINHYFQAIFAYNHELVADFKWRIFCANNLPIKPKDFEKRITDIIEMHNNSLQELERRRAVFLSLWNDTIPLIEKEVGMQYNEFKDTV